MLHLMKGGKYYHSKNTTLMHKMPLTYSLPLPKERHTFSPFGPNVIGFIFRCYDFNRLCGNEI